MSTGLPSNHCAFADCWLSHRDEMALKGVPDYELPPQVDAEGHVVGNNDYRGYSAHDGAHPLPSA
jgi:hypothetical protein